MAMVAARARSAAQVLQQCRRHGARPTAQAHAAKSKLHFSSKAPRGTMSEMKEVPRRLMGNAARYITLPTAEWQPASIGSAEWLPASTGSGRSVGVRRHELRKVLSEGCMEHRSAGQEGD